MSHRILFVVDSFQPAGRALQLDLLTRDLARTYDVHLVSLRIGDTHFESGQSSDEKRTFHCLGKEERNLRNSIASQIRVSIRLRKLVGRLRPAVVHTWSQPADRIASLACLRLKFTKPRIISTELSLRSEKRFAFQQLDRRLSRFAERLIVPHETVKLSCVETGYREPRISVAPNSIALNSSHHGISTNHDEASRKIARRKLLELAGLPENVKVAGAVAPLEARSRLKDLIWATDLLTCIREDFHFVIFGSGSQLARLKKFASQTEAQSHVHFVGEPDNTCELVSGLNFFLHSHLNEPQPLILLHAMASGVPAISVYGPGTTEIIRHQETGFAVNFGARDEFARWTKYMLELPNSAKQLAEQGQEFVRREYPVEKTTAVYREIYEVGF